MTSVCFLRVGNVSVGYQHYSMRQLRSVMDFNLALDIDDVTCHQYICCPTSVTNIDLIVSEITNTNILVRKRATFLGSKVLTTCILLGNSIFKKIFQKSKS